MKQLQIKDHDQDMLITITKDSLRVVTSMLHVRVLADDLSFDDKKCIVSATHNFILLLNQDNYNQLKDAVNAIQDGNDTDNSFQSDVNTDLEAESNQYFRHLDRE